MTDKEILDYNERCAKFLGLKQNIHGNYLLPRRQTWYGGNSYSEWADTDSYVDDSVFLGYTERCWALWITEMSFHYDWNWIMEVVQRIENTIAYINIKGCAVDISTIVNTSAPTKKKAVVEAINNILIWYDENKRKD